MDCHGVFIRMAEPSDSPSVEAAFKSSRPRLRASSGSLNFTSIIETSLYTFVGLSPYDEVVAFAAFNDTPSVPGCVFGKRSVEAKAWAAKQASDSGFFVENSLWLELCATVSDADETLLESFLCAVFKLSPDTKVVLDLSPFDHAKLPQLLTLVSRSQEMGLILSACMQSTVLPTFNVKRAVVEHHDDLLPVIKRAQKRGAPLAQIPDIAAPTYPYAVARLIAAQDTSNIVYIAEVNNDLVGLIAITRNVDTNFLFHFKLDIFGGLTLPEIPSSHLYANSGSALPDHEPSLSSPLTEEKHANLNNRMETHRKSINAFQITMFCLEEEYANRALDLISSLFVYEKMDYCLVALPYSKPAPAFIRYFTRICEKELVQEKASLSRTMLYVLHRQSLVPGFEVRQAKSEDIGGLKGLLDGFKDQYDIVDYIEHPIKGCMTMLAASHNQIVGFTLVLENSPSEALFSHFDLFQLVHVDQQHGVNHAIIVLFVLNPIFTNRRRQFLREIMRQMGKSAIFCPVFPCDELPDVIEDMILVPGRQHASVHSPCIWGQVSEAVPLPGRASFRTSLSGSVQHTTSESKTALRRGQYFGFDCALFLMTHRLISRHPAVVNSRIIVVGASQTTAACLHKLVTCANMRFSNLTLVSPFGFNGLSLSSKKSLDIGQDVSFQKMGIDCQVKVVASRVVGLERKAQCISLSNGHNMQYDYLILLTGLQDQTRWWLQKGLQNGVVHMDELAMLLEDGSINLDEVHMSFPVVIYGLSLETFCSIQLLISRGVAGNCIVLVYPEVEPLESLVEIFCGDSSISKLLVKETVEAGVVVKSGLKLRKANLGETKNAVQSLLLECVQRKPQDHFNSKSLSTDDEATIGSVNSEHDCCGWTEHIQQPCMLLVTSGEKHVDHDIFQAIKKEGLVFNGRVVIDGNFQTNDPYIFASGTLSKFSRQCGKHPKLEAFNSHELGRNLANAIISLFKDHLPDQSALWGGLLPSPFEVLPDVRQAGRWPRISVPRMVQPKCTGGLLPGELLFFNVKCPGYACQDSEKNVTQPFVVKKDGCILRIDFKKTHEIGSITYCGKCILEAWKIVRLVGLHDSMMNNIVSKGTRGVIGIEDLFSHPWFTLIFHDKFLEFYNQLCSHIYDIFQKDPQEQNVVEDLITDDITTFMSMYKADFPGKFFACPGFDSNMKQMQRREYKVTDSTNTRKCTSLQSKDSGSALEKEDPENWKMDKNTGDVEPFEIIQTKQSLEAEGGLIQLLSGARIPFATEGEATVVKSDVANKQNEEIDSFIKSLFTVVEAEQAKKVSEKEINSVTTSLLTVVEAEQANKISENEINTVITSLLTAVEAEQAKKVSEKELKANMEVAVADDNLFSNPERFPSLNISYNSAGAGHVKVWIKNGESDHLYVNFSVESEDDKFGSERPVTVRLEHNNGSNVVVILS